MKNFELGEELAEDANRLIFIKKSIAEFEEEEKAIKKKLEPQIGLAKPLLIPDGIIYFCSKKTAKSFNRTEVLEFILIVTDYGVGRKFLSEAEINRFCNQLS